MPKPKTEVCSVRLPVGLATEIRAITDIPFSVLTRQLLEAFLAREKSKMAQRGPAPAKPSFPITRPQTPTEDINNDD